MKTHRLLVCVSVVVVSVGLAASGADAKPPASSTHLAVSSGATKTGVNGHLTTAGSISGTITAATGGGALSTYVTAYLHGVYVGSDFSDGSGNYTIPGLAGDSVGFPYVVCAEGQYASGGSSTTGYIGRCYQNANWNGGTLPAGTTNVPVKTGQQKTGINIALVRAAAVTGKLENAADAGIGSVTVIAYNRSNGFTYSGSTLPSGTYAIKGLTSSANGYTVCFSPSSASPGTGFLPRCFTSTAWNGLQPYPASATKVTVTLGATKTGVNGTLAVAGAIAGKVTDAVSNAVIKFASIVVFNSAGTFLAAGSTDATGQYVVRNLAAASGDRVCVRPVYVSPTTGYNGKCWMNVAYNGGSLPGGTNAVSVTLNATHNNISLKLNKTTSPVGSIAGKVTEKAGGHALNNASVQAYTSAGSYAGGTTTDSSGNYKLSNLPPSASGYVVCANPSFASSTVSPPATGWAPGCNLNQPWDTQKPPASAAKFSLAANQNRTGVNVALGTGGAISGTTFAGAGSTPAKSILVRLFRADGSYLMTTFSDFTTGVYAFKGLSPKSASSTSGYVVCFDGRTSFGGGPSYRPQCYNGVPWDGSSF